MVAEWRRSSSQVLLGEETVVEVLLGEEIVVEDPRSTCAKVR
jgi:hypothetical protein